MTEQQLAAMRQALEALESYQGFIEDAHILEGQWHWIDGTSNAAPTLRTAIEQAETAQGQEPVAWIYTGIRQDGSTHGPHLVWKLEYMDVMSANKGAKANAIPLYTNPPAAALKPLTDKMLNIIASQWHMNLLVGKDKADVMSFARAIEAAHGITGEAK